jgi:hypothetical protein
MILKKRDHQETTTEREKTPMEADQVTTPFLIVLGLMAVLAGGLIYIVKRGDEDAKKAAADQFKPLFDDYRNDG